ncbi:MAG TPA: hypothetical protein VHA35_19600 [Dongiaceae bacterium]|jgi:hypothetical protein|nr:hypothetical protein [Dongiaceae bacterium]
MEAFVNRMMHAVRRILHWADERLPRGLRSVFGLLLIIGGLAGLLPVLGFWMIPAGLAMIALDIPPWRRWLKRRIGRLRPPDDER